MDVAVATWRREQRAALLARRQTLSPEDRRQAASVIASKLEALIADRGFHTIGLFWPIKLEITLISWASALSARTGIALCLPVVVTPRAPLEYWRWTQGEPLTRGAWDIPVPAKRDVVTPDLMLAPLVGFDRANYRLGYGGGYFDRTLAAFPQRPAVIGVGYAFSALETIFPQPHDIPMDAVLTEQPSHG
jgi:5-formyltetrahydrofolate cyclo-ligase